MANDQQMEPPRPTAPNGSWEDYTTEHHEDRNYPVPRDWTVSRVTDSVTLWERPTEQTETPASCDSDRAMLITNDRSTTRAHSGVWFTFVVNGDPIVNLHNPDPSAAWDIIAEILLHTATDEPLLNPADLENERGPFEHAECLAKSDLEDVFNA